MQSRAYILLIAAIVSIGSTANCIDVVKLSDAAVHRCVRDKELEEKLREIVFSPVLPEDDENFIEFYECFCKELKILDDDGNMDLDVVRIIYSNYITKKISSKVDAMQLTNEAIEKCEKIPLLGKPGLYAIKRRNCGNKLILERI
ncbi:hypothetical protein FQA39_LY11739 [Lamprigera yunnana]|nr:hypothetical protein FQA39_LY11739 [Lamprigera yunnana]